MGACQPLAYPLAIPPESLERIRNWGFRTRLLRHCFSQLIKSFTTKNAPQLFDHVIAYSDDRECIIICDFFRFCSLWNFKCLLFHKFIYKIHVSETKYCKRSNAKQWYSWPALCRDESKVHEIETSWEWSLLWVPHLACEHCVMSVSLPTHSTSLNQICPLPGPYSLPIYWPLYLTEHSHLDKYRLIFIIAHLFSQVFHSDIHTKRTSWST